jgi:hypothetical protein
MVVLAAASVVPLLGVYAFWVDLDGYGGAHSTAPWVLMLQGGAAALFALAVFRRRRILLFYTTWAITCLGVVASLFVRPGAALVREGSLLLGGTCVVLGVGMGIWVFHPRRE